LVTQVGQVLGRGHALFGEPAASGRLAAKDAGSTLAAAADLVRGGHTQMSTQGGVLALDYAGFATDTGPTLDGAGAADDHLGRNLHDAAGTDRSGRRSSKSVLTGAATDTAALAPSSGSAVGQRAIVSALRARVAQQRRVIAAYQLRDAGLATEFRSLAYSRAAGRGETPTTPMPFAGSGFGEAGRSGGAPLSGWPGLSGLGRPGRGPRTSLASNVDSFNRDGGGAGGPGEGAAQAALSKLGRPYVWGAKGPNRFDCSGLTQWAWRQAGVQLGGDTYSQLADGVPVPPGQVRAGDLIFPLDAFGEGGRSGPGHVQLAISGTEVVHAPHTGDVVRVAPMPARYVARRPARSVLT
jgi:cell wall-associated NlpC family hydrolase